MFWLDLDGFKAVNDAYGHAVGDLLLKQVGERLLGCVRDADVVARFGGDEFAILQYGANDETDASTLAARAGTRSRSRSRSKASRPRSAFPSASPWVRAAMTTRISC